MKRIVFLLFMLIVAGSIYSQSCTPQGNQASYGTNNLWIGYVYDNIDFTNYAGYVNEGNTSSPNFDESFGGDVVSYPTNGCSVTTETFSVRYKLTKTFTSGTYQVIVGGDDGYRLSLDGGATWTINKWLDQSYTTTTVIVTLSGTVNLVLEYYENGGQNRISFNIQTACIGSEDQSVYGVNGVWNGYVYYGQNFNLYKGLVHEGVTGVPNFDESFGGDNVTYNSSGCPIQTENFSVRYRLQAIFSGSSYIFTVGGDDGYRLSLDGGSTWVINKWQDQSYNTTSYSTTLSGTKNLVLEYYENGGGNRVSFSMTGSIVLPLQLLNFQGKSTGNIVQLNWETSREVNVAYYEIQRSNDQLGFTAIGKVDAKDISSGQNIDYSYSDHFPLNGNNYYRLRMTDINGNYTYSPVVVVSFEQNTSASIFPTVLTANTIYVRAGSSMQNASLSFYEITGRKLEEIQLPKTINAGETISASLNIGSLSKGTYLVVCKSSGATIIKQLVLVQ
ncbi:MAG: hypothetical protein JST87_12460 [Bacteroidetes bacterium]|nr:hypothetical protein [Bacteroidota bacterium]